MRLLLALALLPIAAAASPGPQPLPPPPPLPVTADVPYPGVIALEADARDTSRRIVRVHETLPVTPGPLVLLYPEFVAGAHYALNTVDHLTGLAISAAGRRLAWRRDPVATHAFHLDVPPGVVSLDIRFELLTPTDPKQGRVTITDDIAHLQWESLVLYPAGHFARQIAVEPSVLLPAGWQLGTALETASSTGTTTRFRRTDLETLLDSPVMAGGNFRRIDLDDGPRAVRLDLVADDPGSLAITEAQIATLQRLVAETDRLFGGARHFAHYDWLLALSDSLGGIGREHLQSSENAAPADTFTAWDKVSTRRALLPHEYVHSWNGKFRRGADSWRPDSNSPIGNSLLWVYEGQTQYWGIVLAARAGLLTPAQARDMLAQTAATAADPSGRAWRTLADTTNDPQVQMRRPQPWASRIRNQDYYGEGALVWLDADTLIRERSQGARSLDDFARDFFGGDGRTVTETYNFDDVVAALNRVLPYDWAAFLRARLEANDRPPLDGLIRGGYRLDFADMPTDYQKSADAVARRTDLSWSIGFIVESKDATLSAVRWDGPAYKAGLTAGSQLIAVGGVPYTPELLLAAIRAAKGGGPPVELIVKSLDRLGGVTIDWHGGLRYPALMPDAAAAKPLDAILAPRTEAPPR